MEIIGANMRVMLFLDLQGLEGGSANVWMGLYVIIYGNKNVTSRQPLTGFFWVLGPCPHINFFDVGHCYATDKHCDEN